MATILITGGAGYIGSHIALLLHQQGHTIIIVDALVHKQKWAHTWANFVALDIADHNKLDALLSSYTIDTVIHCAAFIDVGASVTFPLSYYVNNVGNTLFLLDAMRNHSIKNIIFSSTCAVYGIPHTIPIAESHIKNPINPYGRSKSMVEDIFKDCAHAYGLRAIALRYFNAAGSMHGLYECHKPETHLIPLLFDAAYNKKPFSLYGTDHPTPDGTCIRDFLHVWDIAYAHSAALDELNKAYMHNGGLSCYNLGTGNGYSVKQVIAAVEQVTGIPIAVSNKARRAGDPPILIADPTKAYKELGWKAEYSDLQTIIAHAAQGYHDYHHSFTPESNNPGQKSPSIGQ